MENLEAITSLAERVTGNVEKVILGKRHEVRMTLIALLCEGHVLIEDVPGTGKTMLAKSLAKSPLAISASSMVNSSGVM